MSAVPGDTAVTFPVVGCTVATAVLVLLQVPPPVPLLEYVAEMPTQSGDAPLTVPAVTV